MATKLYVGGLAYATTEDKLKEVFSTYGNVIGASVIKDKFSGKSKGFGFVELDTAEAAQAAIDAQNGKELDGRTVTVSIAREKTEGERRNGGFHSNNGGYHSNGPRRDNNGGSFRFR